MVLNPLSSPSVVNDKGAYQKGRGRLRLCLAAGVLMTSALTSWGQGRMMLIILTCSGNYENSESYEVPTSIHFF